MYADQLINIPIPIPIPMLPTTNSTKSWIRIRNYYKIGLGA